MTTVIEEFVAKLGWDIDSKELDKFNKDVKDLGETVVKVGKWLAAGTAALTGFAVITNEATARQYRLAQAVGMSASTVDALAHTFSGLGFDSEKVIDNVEELNNKLGELKGMGEMNSATEALHMMGIAFKEIQDLKPEQQYIKIMDAAKQMADQQEAVSAVDMLMGGDANRMLGFLRTQEGTLADLVTRYEKLNFLTNVGREGAVKFSDAWRSILAIFKSLVGQFAGVLGEALTPMLDKFTDWILINKELVQSKIVDFVDTLVSAIKSLVSLGSFLTNIISKMGGLENVVKLIGIAFLSWKVTGLLRSIDKMTKGSGDLLAALKLLKKPVSGAAAKFGQFGIIVMGALAWWDLIETLQGKKSMFDEIHQALGKGLQDATHAVGEWFGVSGEWVDQWVVSVVAGVPAVIEGAWVAIKGLWNEMDLVATAALNAIAEAIYSVLSGIDNFINGIVKKFWSFLKNPFGSAPGSVGGLPDFSLPGAPKLGSVFTPSTFTTPVTNSSTVNNSPSVVVNVAKTNASPADVARAAEAGMTKALAKAARNNR